jgi:hypothetical protein
VFWRGLLTLLRDKKKEDLSVIFHCVALRFNKRKSENLGYQTLINSVWCLLVQVMWQSPTNRDEEKSGWVTI